MGDFFPHGFWANVAMVGVVIFLLFGMDLLLLKARIVTNLSRFVNKSFHVDEALIRLLEGLKRTSDHEFDVEHTLLKGWRRFAVGGVMVVAALLLLNILPSLR